MILKMMIVIDNDDADDVVDDIDKDWVADDGINTDDASNIDDYDGD